MRHRQHFRDSRMTKLLIFLFLLAAIIVVFFMGSAKSSAKMQPPTLVGGDLPACGEKPNCVCSTAEPGSDHYISAITIADLSLQDLQQAVEASGGVVVKTENNLLTARYTSTLFGFIDDVLLLKLADKIDVRSSSRVGYSDMNANRKRVERLRHLLGTARNS